MRTSDDCTYNSPKGDYRPHGVGMDTKINCFWCNKRGSFAGKWKGLVICTSCREKKERKGAKK